MINKLGIALAAEHESLTAFRDFILNACQDAALKEEEIYDIRLAVEEVCVNIIDHGYKGMNPGTINISFQYGSQQVVIRLTDYGYPFEPSEPPPPNADDLLDTPDKGGLGLHFIYRSVDAVTYESTESGNTLTLIKRLN